MTIVLDREADVLEVDHPSWWAQACVQKWDSDDDFLAGKAPNEILTLEKNLLLLAGITRLSNLICGTGTWLTAARAASGTTNGSATVTDASAALSDLGSAVVGPGIPANTYVIAPIVAGTSYTLSANATATASVTLYLTKPNGAYGPLARIGVGDSSTAAAQSQTALQAASNKVLVTVTSATLTGGSPNKMQWVASFAPGVGEWGTGWQEWVVDNGATAGETLNRFVQNLGTKTGGTWTLTVTIGIA